MKVFVNNKFVPEHSASVSVFDHGFMYGDGIFETLRSYEGVIFRLKDHIGRLRRSARYMKLKVPYRDDELISILYQAVEGNKLSDAYIRISVSRGKGPIGLDPALCPTPTVVLIAKEFTPYPEEMYTKGVKIMIAKTRRNLKEAVNPGIKSMNFLNNIMAGMEAKKTRAFEAIMLDYKGYVTEGTISNIFMVKKRVLVTPSAASGILDGITRKIALSLAKKIKIPTRERPIKPEELRSADEIFLTNTTMEIMPVGRIDAKRMKPGDITVQLKEAFRKEVRKEITTRLMHRS